MIRQSLEQLALAQIPLERLRAFIGEAINRPQGARGIGIDWYQPAHRHLEPKKQRYVVCIFVWEGNRWRRSRKMSGPLLLANIQSAVDRIAARMDLPTINRA